MFLNIIMLAGIGGAAVPLVLHLLNRARYRTVDWGAMMFLTGDDARQRQSAKLKQLLLLLARMALVALLAIALARPLVAARWNPAGQDLALTAVILLDRSGSMAYDENGHPRLDEARQAVREILATMRRGDEVALVTLGDGLGGPAPRPTADLQAINDALAGGDFVKPGYGVANMADGLRVAADVFDRARSTNRALFVVCDRQALNWGQVTEKFAAGWRSRMSMPGPIPRFVLVPVGGDEADNVAVDSINMMAPEVIVGQPVDVEGVVRNYGPTPRPALPLSLLINGRDIKTTVNVAPRSAATVRLPATFFAAGSQLIAARVESTGLTTDDTMVCPVDVVNPINVLIVSGQLHRDKQLNQTDYLKLALMPFAALGRANQDVAAVTVVTPTSGQDWSDFDGKKFRVVILADVPEITAAQARALEQHVYAGGGLLIAPGGLTRIDNLNEMLYRQGAGILPARLKPATPADGSGATSILGIELSHPLFRFLKGKPDPIPSAIVGRYFPAADRRLEGQVLASFASGSPFVVEGNFGRGKVLLVTSPLDGDWGTLPMTNFYLPMVQSAVRFLAARPSRSLQPGEPLIADFDDAGAGRFAVVTTPSRKTIQVPLQPAGDQVEARYAETREPGVYTAVIPEFPRQILQFVVQRPREELDITPLTAERWQALSRQLGFRMIEPSSGLLAGVMVDERAKRELWPFLLAGVLILAVAEVAMAKAWSHDAA